MKKITIIFFILLSVTVSAQNYEWAKTMKGTRYSAGWKIALDNQGSVYILGNFHDTIDFDPGPGIFNLISNSGSADIFIQKLDSNGNLIWAKRVGGNLADTPNSLTLDSWGNVYLAGGFQDTVDFDPGLGVSNFVSNGSADAFILKLDGNGNFIWAKTFGASNSDHSRDIATDPVGNPYIVGVFYNTVDFDPGPGTNFVTSNGAVDMFILKLDSNGNFLWVKTMGTNTYESFRTIEYTSLGNLVLTGAYKNNSLDFDPGPGTHYVSSSGSTNNAFILKLDALGNFLWVREMTGLFPSSSCDAMNTSIDSVGNIYSGGGFGGTVNFDQNTGNLNFTAYNNGYDVYIQKLDSNSNLL